MADGWQGRTIRSILENPCFTGYAVFGRWTKHGMIADPDDVAAGHVNRLRRAAPEGRVGCEGLRTQDAGAARSARTPTTAARHPCSRRARWR
jgi:hypothetical protein